MNLSILHNWDGLHVRTDFEIPKVVGKFIRYESVKYCFSEKKKPFFWLADGTFILSSVVSAKWVAKSFDTSITALATAIVGVNLSIRSFKCLMTFRAFNFLAKMSCYALHFAINSFFSIMADARLLCVKIFEQIQFSVLFLLEIKLVTGRY